MRAAHNNGGAAGGNGAAFLPRLCFIVECMRVTGKGRTWHEVGVPHVDYSLAAKAAKHVNTMQALTVRVRPAIR